MLKATARGARKRAQSRSAQRGSAKLSRVSIDTEWFYKRGPESDGKFRCASWKETGANKPLYGTLNINKLADLVAKLDDKAVITGQNVYTDLTKYVQWGIRLPGDFSIRDSLIGVRFVEPLRPEKGLKQVGRTFGYVYHDRKDVEDPRELLDYCGKDVVTSEALADIFEQRAKEKGVLNQLYCYYEMQKAFMAVELAGLKLDVPSLQADLESHAKAMKPLLKQIGNPNLITNDDELRDWLRERYTEKQLDVLPISRKSQEQSISHEHLRMLTPQTDELEAIGRARSLDKFRKLYVEAPLKHANEHGFIFPSYMLLVAKTQRRSSRPNIQNWPSPKPCKECKGYCLKHATMHARRRVMSRFPDGVIMSHDYMNLEARIFSWQAKCWSFLECLIAGGYIKVAEECLGIKIESKDDPRYKQVKSTVLAVTYNMTPGLFAWREFVASGGKVRMSKADAQRHYDALFNRWPEIADEMERRRNYGWATGHAYSSVGVDIPLPLVPSDLKMIMQVGKQYNKKIENFCINWPTQQFAGYVTGCALIDIMRHVTSEAGGWGSYLEKVWDSTQGLVAKSTPNTIPCIEVHDALDVDTRKPQEAHEMVHYYMTKGDTLKTLVPDFPVEILNTEVASGRYWDYEE